MKPTRERPAIEPTVRDIVGPYSAGSYGAWVLVTGGAGYIGSLLVRRLLGLGFRVRVLDSFLYGDEAIRDLVGHAGIEIVEGDTRDRLAVESAVRDVDAVVHLAAIVGDPACAFDEDFAVETNFAATRILVDECRRAGIARFVFASTCSVYGASDGTLNESSALNPVSLYANTKIDSEQLVLSERDASFSPVVLRFGTAYGWSHRQRFDLVVNLLTAKAVLEGVITVHGGSQWRPFVHVDDIARAVIRALESPLDVVAGEIFNIGSDEQNHRLGEIGELIQDVAPAARIVTNDEVVDHRNYYVDFSKARNRLGFTPVREMPESIREMAEAVQQLGTYRLSVHSNEKFLIEGDPALRLPMNGVAARV